MLTFSETWMLLTLMVTFSYEVCILSMAWLSLLYGYSFCMKLLCLILFLQWNGYTSNIKLKGHSSELVASQTQIIHEKIVWIYNEEILNKLKCLAGLGQSMPMYIMSKASPKLDQPLKMSPAHPTGLLAQGLIFLFALGGIPLGSAK